MNKNPANLSRLSPRVSIGNKPLQAPATPGQSSVNSGRHSMLSQVQFGTSILNKQATIQSPSLFDKPRTSCLSRQSISVRDSDIPIGHELVKKQHKDELEKKKLKWSGDFKPKSVSKDIIDQIYDLEDPIGESLQQRKDRGAVVTTVLRDMYTHNGRFYFTLKLKKPECQ